MNTFSVLYFVENCEYVLLVSIVKTMKMNKIKHEFFTINTPLKTYEIES